MKGQEMDVIDSPLAPSPIRTPADALRTALIGMVIAVCAPLAEAASAEAEARRQAAQERREQRQADRDARSSANREAREQKAADKQDWCETFRVWATRHDGVPPEVLQARYGGGALAPEVARIRIDAWAFQDDRLRQLLGKTFEELSDTDLDAISRRGTCHFGPATPQARPLVTGDVFTRAQHPRFQADVRQDLAAIRKAQADAKAASAELALLAVDSAGARRYDQLASAAAALRPMLAEPARAALTAALNAAGTRVVAPALAERARTVIAGASGADGLAVLTKLRREIGERRLQVPPELGAGLQRLASEVAADERRRLDGLGSGAAALERGVQWQRDYQQRIAPYAADLPELRALPADLEQRRAQAYQVARGDLVAQIGRTQSAAELEQWVSRTTLPGDAGQPAGAAVLAKVDERRELFERNRVLGRAPTDASRPAPAAPEVPVAKAAQRSADGGPSEEQIYQAVNDYYRGVNQASRETAERCNKGEAKNDLMLAMQCVALGGAVGPGSGGTIRSAEFRLTRLQRIGCAPASGQPGYVCDYVLGYEGNLNLPPSMGNVLRNGSVSQGRFIVIGNRWQLMPMNRE
jgi:hypothetical protein